MALSAELESIIYDYESKITALIESPFDADDYYLCLDGLRKGIDDARRNSEFIGNEPYKRLRKLELKVLTYGANNYDFA